jgi:putative flippase GtrA
MGIQLPNGMGQIDEITAQTIALLCAFIGSFLWGFALNKYVVFTASPVRGRIQLFRYSVIVATCILFNYLLMNFFTLNMTMNAMVARVITSLIVAVYSYLIQRSFTFQVSKEINPEQ